MSDNDIRSLKGDVNRLSSYLNYPNNLSAAQINTYLTQADNLIQEKSALFATNSDTQAAKAQLEKSMHVSLKDLVDAKLTPPVLKSVTAAAKTIGDNDVRQVVSDVNRLSSFLDRPGNLSVSQINNYLEQADKLLQEQKEVFAFNAASQAAKAQLEKSMLVSVKDLVDAKHTPPALKSVTYTPSSTPSVSDMDIRTIKGDVNRLSSFLDRPGNLSAAQIKDYLTKAENLLKDKAHIFAHNADTQAAKAQLEKSMAVSNKDLASVPAKPAAGVQPAKPAAGAAPAKPAAAPAAASGGALSAMEERSFIGDCNRLNSFMQNPIQIMEDSGPEKLEWYIAEAEKALAKAAGNETLPSIAKYHQDLTKNLENCRTNLKTHGAKYAAEMEERYALEDAAQNWSMRDKNIVLKNEDSIVYRFAIAAGAISTETSVNARVTDNNFCCTGDKITLLATKQSLIVPDGCTRIVIKNKVMSTQ